MKRVLTAFLVIPPLILFFLYGPPYALWLIISVVSFLGLMEFNTLTSGKGRWFWALLGTGICPFFQWGEGLVLIFPLALLLITISSAFLFLFPHDREAFPQGALIFGGICYIPFLLSHLLLLNNLYGKGWILMLIGSVWVGDTLALVVGTLWGRHPLYPQVSPKKTKEGALACLAGVVAMVLIFRPFLSPLLSVGRSLFLAAGVSLFAQLGDLFESMLKRRAGVKDSGGLIPGHGGMLDRLDSFLFSAPFLFYFLHFLPTEA